MTELCGSLVSVLLLKDKIKHLPKYIIHSETFHWFCTVDTLRPVSSGSITTAGELPGAKGYLQSLGTTLPWRWAGFWNWACILENGENSLCIFYIKGQQGDAGDIFLLLILLPGYLWWYNFFLKKKAKPLNEPKPTSLPLPNKTNHSPLHLIISSLSISFPSRFQWKFSVMGWTSNSA